MRIKALRCAIALALILCAATLTVIVTQRRDNSSYNREINGIDHISASIPRMVGDSLILVDPATGYEWTAIQQRLCIHLPWGVDIFYDHTYEEPRWVCHGSIDMSEYPRYEINY